MLLAKCIDFAESADWRRMEYLERGLPWESNVEQPMIVLDARKPDWKRDVVGGEVAWDTSCQSIDP